MTKAETVGGLRPASKSLAEATERILERASTLSPCQGPTDAEIARFRASSRAASVVARELASAGVPRRYLELEIDGSLVPVRALELLETWRVGGCLLLAGPPGTGKTATLVHLLRHLYLAGEVSIVEELGRPALRYSWPTLRFAKVRTLYAAVFQKNGTPIGEARRAGVLALDDWGAAYEHAWPLAELDGLVDDRWDRGLPTLVSTNLQATQEAGGAFSFEALAERAYSRLCAAPGPGLVVLDRRDLRR